MNRLQKWWGQYLKAHSRLIIAILALSFLAGLLILTATTSFAQGHQSIEQTFRPTLTSSITPSQTSTFTITPSETPTITPTITSTPTITPTITVTPSPTLTGTQPTATTTPSPTVTGTLVPVASLSIAVTPTQAKVNESFTFTIKVGNTGTGPTHNNIVFDVFETYLTVSTVTSTPRGTVTKLTNQFVVNIGDVYPGEVITIVAVVTVNNTLTSTQTKSNVVTLTYETNKSLTASLTYKAIYQALPPTGDLPLDGQESGIQARAIIPGAMILLMGGLLLLITLLPWVKSQPYKMWLTVAGCLLVLVGFTLGVNASGVLNQTGTNAQNPQQNYIAQQGQLADATVTALPRLPAWAFATPDNAYPIETLPDYPIPTPILSVTPQPGQPGPDTSPVVRIVIPGMSLDTEVKYVPYDGYSWMISGLRQEVAWMGNTSWPGLGSNTALAGHVTVAGLGDGPFRHLNELPSGEMVVLYTEKNIYTYQVRESKVTGDDDFSVIGATDKPQITMITCIDWDDNTKTYLNRLVVFADLVKTEPITMGFVP